MSNEDADASAGVANGPIREHPGVWQQVRRNAVALISLCIALTGLAYNTWRNELTEENRNIRSAGFEILVHLGELQLVADYARYEQGDQRGNPITGWAHVGVISDLSNLMPPPAPDRAESLRLVWQNNWDTLIDSDASSKAVTDAIGEMRLATQTQLRELD